LGTPTPASNAYSDSPAPALALRPRDLHTTLLYQMGLNQDALSYMYLGRKERLTEVRGEILKEIVA